MVQKKAQSQLEVKDAYIFLRMLAGIKFVSSRKTNPYYDNPVEADEGREMRKDFLELIKFYVGHGRWTCWEDVGTLEFEYILERLYC